jgi:hypothetical protein
MKRRKQTIPAPPSMELAINVTMPDADKSWLPLRPYARYFAGLGWIVDSVTEASIQYLGHPISEEPMHRYDVTVMPQRYFQ